jgi:predicted TIM-barrel fold metal-dependent hydrolase
MEGCTLIRRRSDGREFLIVGDHTHMGKSSMVARFLGTDERQFLGPQMVAALDEAGVDATVTFSVANPSSDYSVENQAVLAAAKAYPSRLIPFARMNPHHEDRAAASVKGYVEAGVRGLKFHSQLDAFPINDPVLVRPILEEANKYGLLALFHSGESWTSTPGLILDLALDYKNITFIIGHMGQFGFDTEAMFIARRAENIYLDTSEHYPPIRIRHAVNAVGKDRVMFGSDTPFVPLRLEVDKIVRYSQLSDDELDAILGLNLLRLLGMSPDMESYRKNIVEFPYL